MARIVDLAEMSNSIHNEIDAAKEFARWDPPAGNYDCLLLRFVESTALDEKTDTRYPTYRVTLQFVDPSSMAKDTVTRFFSTKPGKSEYARGIQLCELMDLARAANGGAAPTNIIDAVSVLKAKQESAVVNVSVRVELDTKGNKNPDGTPRTYTRYGYSAAE